MDEDNLEFWRRGRNRYIKVKSLQMMMIMAKYYRLQTQQPDSDHWQDFVTMCID